MAKALGLADTSPVVGLIATSARIPAPTACLKDRVVTLDEVSYHDDRKDCWIVIYDRVYDITNFLEEHPGGDDVMLEHAGRDASFAFRAAGHSPLALKALGKYFVGELPLEERIFRKPRGFKLSNMPE